MTITKTITKWLTGAALAGALLMAAPHKAEAQRVGFGISIGGGGYGGYYGGPGYARPYPYAYGYPYYGPAYYGGGYYGGGYYRGGYGGGYYRGGYGGGYARGGYGGGYARGGYGGGHGFVGAALAADSAAVVAVAGNVDASDRCSGRCGDAPAFVCL